MFIVESIAPIFLLIAFGKILMISGLFEDHFFKGLNRLVFRFALPALLISSISRSQLEPETLSQLTLLLTIATLATLLAAWVSARLLKLPGPSMGAFIQGSFRGNGAFVALPIIIYALGSDPHAEMLGTVLLAPIVILFNLLSVTILLHYGDRSSRRDTLLTFATQIFKNPLIIGCAIGLTLNLSGLTLPVFIYRPISILGHAALPMVLLSIGASLEFGRLRGAASPSLIASIIKLVVSPLLGAACALLFFRELGSTERMIALLYLASPAAGMSYVMAEVMGNDGPLAGRIVALSTVLSAATIPIILALGL